MRICANGYSDACDENSGQLECYREFRFNLDDVSLENAQLFQGAGFAKANYNTRVVQIGVSFVGTAIKNCEGITDVGTCESGIGLRYV